MRVLVTGGTGFVGSHAAAALSARGHDVRLLVRSPEKVGPVLEALGVAVADVVAGDVTDAASVRAALAGCDSVVHAAALVSLKRGDEEHLREVNVGGTEAVIDTALDRGADPVVHVSSFTVLAPDAGRICVDSAVGRPEGAYAASKADAERVARARQERGAPVVIVYPGGVWGPHDTNLGEPTQGLRFLLGGRERPITRGGFPIVDVRDVAAVIAAAVEPGRGPRRYLAFGRYVAAEEVLRILAAATGREIRPLALPASVARAGGRFADAINERLPVQLIWGSQAVAELFSGVTADDAATWSELGMTPRPVEDTLADTIVWLAEAGVLPVRRIGKLSSRLPRPPS